MFDFNWPTAFTIVGVCWAIVGFVYAAKGVPMIGDTYEYEDSDDPR